MEAIHKKKKLILPDGPVITKDPLFYRGFFPLLIVISLQYLASLTVNLIDNVMLGRYSEMALSGATLVNQLQFLLQQSMSGIGAGITVLGSQYWGKRNTGPIKQIVSVGMKFSLALGFAFTVVTLILPYQVLSIFTNDNAVISEGVSYLRIMAYTYLIYSVSMTLMYSLQSVETAFIGTIMSCSTIIINACLNYALIYGHFGCPELGIRGAAFATLTSRIVELMIILVYVLKIDKKLRMTLPDIFGMDFEYIRDFSRAALPVLISGFMWGIAQGVQTAILGHMDSAVIAANSIATVIMQLFIVFSTGSGSAASVTMGKTVGAGKLERVKEYARTLQLIFIVIGLVSAASMFLCRDAVVRFYAVSDEAKKLASDFITILSVAVIGSCYEWPVEGGVIAGGGDTKYTAICDNLFMWLFTIPSAILSAFVFQTPAWVVFCFLKADQLIKCIPNAIYCNSFRWVRVLTRDASENDKTDNIIEN